eukprot:366185_1
MANKHDKQSLLDLYKLIQMFFHRIELRRVKQFYCLLCLFVGIKHQIMLLTRNDNNYYEPDVELIAMDGNKFINEPRITHEYFSHLLVKSKIFGVQNTVTATKIYDDIMEFDMHLNNINQIAQYTTNQCLSVVRKRFGAFGAKIISEDKMTFYSLIYGNKSVDNLLKFYEDYLEQKTSNSELEELCIANSALIHYHMFTDYNKTASLFLQLNSTQIKDNCFNFYIANCFKHLKDRDKALMYASLHVKQNPTNYDALDNMACICDDLGDYDNGKTFALKAAELAANANDKAQQYSNLGANAYLHGKIHDAITYTQKAIDFADTKGNTAMFLSNIGKYSYKLGQYENSFKYLSQAIEIRGWSANINGNYGIVLYYLNRHNESIKYLDKCLISNTVDDRELLMDCLYIYGKILNADYKFEQSNEKCLQSINSEDFDKLKNKDELYCLMGENHAKMLQFDKAIKYLQTAKAVNSNENIDKQIDTLKELCNDQASSGQMYKHVTCDQMVYILNNYAFYALKADHMKSGEALQSYKLEIIGFFQKNNISLYSFMNIQRKIFGERVCEFIGNKFCD